MHSKSLYAGNRLKSKIKKQKLPAKTFNFIEENISDIITAHIEHLKIEIQDKEVGDEIDFKLLKNIKIKDNVLILNFLNGDYKVGSK